MAGSSAYLKLLTEVTTPVPVPASNPFDQVRGDQRPLGPSDALAGGGHRRPQVVVGGETVDRVSELTVLEPVAVEADAEAELVDALDGAFASAFVRARKP